jgi:hypothetical protein
LFNRICDGSIGSKGRNAEAGRGAEHVPEVRRRAHEHVLDRVGEDPPSLDDAVGQHVELLLQQDDVSGVPGDIGRGVDRDADVGGVQGDRVVHPVTEVGDIVAGVPVKADDAGLLLWVHPGEHACRRQPGGEHVVVEPVDLIPGEDAAAVEAEAVADVLGDGGVVACEHAVR